MNRNIAGTAWLAACLACAGCATYADHLKDIRSAYFDRDGSTAVAKIDVTLKSNPREADVLNLERASILLSEGRAKEAEQTLRDVRDHFDNLEQKDLAEGALAMLTDDQRLAYAGEDYEKVLVRVYLALANLMGDGQDAGAYALQVAAKQQEIIEAGKAEDDKNPKEAYQRVAVGAYLHAALREETLTNNDDAARSLKLVCDWTPDFEPAKQDLERVQHGRHSEPGNGVVYVVTLVGRGPCKEQRMEIPTTVALLIADRILSAVGKQTLPPTVAPIKVPCVVAPVNEVQAVQVAVDGRQQGRTATITDVGKMAVQQSDAMRPYIIARAVARRAIKKAAVYAVKEAMKTEKTGLAALGLDIAGVAWEATESADTRCWGLLPDKIQVLRVELPAGAHQLAVQPVNEQGVPQGPAETVAVDVSDGRNSYVLASFPTGRLAGKVVCSGQAR